MARLLEEYGMDLLDRAGVPVPKRDVASSPAAVHSITSKFDSEVVIKGHVPVGKRMKAGAIKFASSPDEAETVAEDMFGMDVHGYPVEEVLVAEQIPIERELFLSFTLDKEQEYPMAVLSTKGGIDIEAEETGETIRKLLIDPTEPFYEYQAREEWRKLGLERNELVAVSNTTTKLARVFLDTDLETLEINPLVITPDQRAVAVAAVVKPDKATEFRHPALINKVYPGSEHLWRPPNDRELRMQRANKEYEGGDVTYMEFDGDVGLVMYSGGMSLQTIDMLIQNGFAPANYSDINPPANYEKTYALTEILLSRDEVSALLGTGNIANLSRVDVRVEAIVDAIQDSAVNPEQFPVVIRMAGEGQGRAREITNSIPGIDYFADEKTVTEAIEAFISRARGTDLQRDSLERGDIV